MTFTRNPSSSPSVRHVSAPAVQSRRSGEPRSRSARWGTSLGPPAAVVPFAPRIARQRANSACQSIGFAFATAASIGSIAIAKRVCFISHPRPGGLMAAADVGRFYIFNAYAGLARPLASRPRHSRRVLRSRKVGYRSTAACALPSRPARRIDTPSRRRRSPLSMLFGELFPPPGPTVTAPDRPNRRATPQIQRPSLCAAMISSSLNLICPTCFFSLSLFDEPQPREADDGDHHDDENGVLHHWNVHELLDQ